MKAASLPSAFIASRLIAPGFFTLGLIALGIGAPLRADVLQLPAGLKSLEFVEVGDPGNAPDQKGRGAVAYRYRISKYETTTAQWVEFLNAKGRSDPDGGLWINDMDKSKSGEGPRWHLRMRRTTT